MHKTVVMNDSATHKIVRLILAEQEGAITPAQSQELEAWAAQSTANQDFLERCRSRQLTTAALEAMDRIDEEAPLSRFKDRYYEELYPIRKLTGRKYTRWLIAAAIIGIVLAGIWWLVQPSGKPATPLVATTENAPAILPDNRNKAILTLSDGRKITLNDSKDGTLAHDAGARVNKKGDALVYNHDDKATGSQAALAYSYLTTPKGGFYKLTLPDHSTVYLNAESSIRFPNAFTGKERKVTITGEAYFEVTNDPDHPFIVAVNDMEIKVLGTHFNINAYEDLPATKTTLLEGRVEVTKAGKEAVLRPGQQAMVRNITDAGIQLREANLEDVMAWKDGYFSFQGATVQEIMREAKRWYDIDVEYKASIQGNFIAYLPRTLPLNSLLKILEATDNVKFTIEGKKIMVDRPVKP